MEQKCDKMSAFGFIEKFGYQLFHNQSLNYFLSSCTNPMFRKPTGS